ncbi:MAG TPA: phosphatidylglycerol lysyltransferase domain-containing protein, partial [Paracoccaceae bacterium]|nr:phosphatidylglycerol lysyltransferase domain-containing protein [Paracoccaceae bacterium]
MRISRTDVSSIARAQITRLAVRQALLLLGAAGAVLLLTDRLGQIDRADIWRALQTVGPLQWLMAMAATGVSFWAVGRYDAVLHRHLATLTPDAQASRAGLAAIAVSQTLGFGVVTGALVRWRMLPEMSLWQATRLTLAVSGSFIAGWSIVTAVAILVFRPPTGLWFALAWLPLVAILVLITLSLFGLPAVLLRSGVGRAVTLPSLGTIGLVVLLSALDTGAAALALYVLLPAELTPGLSEVLPAFLVALGVSMILGSPGGVGPFEVTLLSLLPGIAASPLLAAVLAYRVVYYGAPALYGAWLLVKGPNPAPQKDVALTPVTAITPKLKQMLHHARRAESGLLNAGAMGLLTSELGNAPMAAGRTRQALVALGDPLADGTAWQSLACLERAASDRGLHPVLYKCGARLAVAARKRGYRVLPVAQEAWLAPAHFDLAAAQCRQLRRKLRKAEQGGIRITRSASAHPYAEMSEIS